jgi:hypothetical protein
MNTANTVNRLRTVMAAALFGAAASSLAALPAAAEAQPSVTVNRHVTNWQSFDVPEAGPGGTSPVAMNDLGVIVGNYSDANGVQHGFVRDAFGCITSFDPPGSQYTAPQGVNQEGVIVGNFYDAAGNSHGFQRSAHGVITVYDDPHAGGSPLNTVIRAINDFRSIVGYFTDASGNDHGFLRKPDGSEVVIDGPGSGGIFTHVGQINDRGEVGGQFFDGSGVWHALLRHPDGHRLQSGLELEW